MNKLKVRDKKDREPKKRKQSEETESEKQIRLKKDRESKKRKQSEQSENERQIRLKNDRESKKPKQSEQTETERQIRLKKARESKKRKQSQETERQIRLEKNRLCQKERRTKSVSQPHNEINQQDYLNTFDIHNNGGIEDQCWANANMNRFHKSVQYIVSQCSVCKEAWPLKSKPRSPYVCSRCSRDKKIP